MTRMTSAYANKLLKQLDEDKNYYLNKEAASCTYVAAVGEEPVIPEYDYAENAAEIAAIDEKIQIIKHALNLANVTSRILVRCTNTDEASELKNGETHSREYSVDTILVRMSQLNRRKEVLDRMRKELPKERQSIVSYSARRNNVPEYKYINYDLNLIKSEYERISKEIMAMQIALDRYNQTYEFEVAI